MRGRRMALAALTAPALLAAQPAGAQQPAGPPAVVLSYYSARELPNIVQALADAGLPTGTPVYYGNYYGTSGSRKPGKGPPKPPPPEVTVPGGLVAPIFGWTPSKFWAGRHKEGGGLRAPAPAFAELGAGPAGRSETRGRQ